jgi:hypothetical protein
MAIGPRPDHGSDREGLRQRTGIPPPAKSVWESPSGTLLRGWGGDFPVAEGLDPPAIRFVTRARLTHAVVPMVSPNSGVGVRAIDAHDIRRAGGMYPAPTSGVVIEYTTHRYATVSPQHPQEYRNTGTPSERRQDHRASMYSVAPSHRRSLPWCPRIPCRCAGN